MTDEISIGIAVWSNIFFRLSIMLLMGVIVFYCATILGRGLNKSRSHGVVIFGVLLILGSIYKLWGFLNYEYYKFMFQQLPEKMVLIRYFASIALRILSLITAIGVLLLQDRFRKLLLLLCLFTLCSIYWKHPFYVFENISRQTERFFFNRAVVEELTCPWRPWVSLIFNYLTDIIFSGSMLYYFTRPKIKEQFI